MSNNFDAAVAEYWAKKLQTEHFKFNAYKYVANSQYEAFLSDGDIFHKSYFDAQDAELGVYTPQSDMAEEDITLTDETLTVNKLFYAMREFDQFQTVQTAFDIAAEVAPKDAQRMANNIDYNVLAEIPNAYSVVDSGVLTTGTADGVGITVATTNVLEIFAAADRKLEENNITDLDRKAIISPRFAQSIKEYLGGRDTSFGDQKLQDGNLKVSFMGYDLLVSNQLYATALLALATQPTDGDTVTIDGITFTFKTALSAGPAVKGEVLIDGSADNARTNLTHLINNPGSTTANHTGWIADAAGVKGDDEYRKLKNRATATNDNAANTMALTYKGKSNLSVSKVLTDPTDNWVATKTICHNFFCAGMPVDMVQQIKPMVEITPAQKRFSRFVKRGMYYGLKTFRENTFKMVDVKTKV